VEIFSIFWQQVMLYNYPDTAVTVAQCGCIYIIQASRSDEDGTITTQSRKTNLSSARRVHQKAKPLHSILRDFLQQSILKLSTFSIMHWWGVAGKQRSHRADHSFKQWFTEQKRYVQVPTVMLQNHIQYCT